MYADCTDFNGNGASVELTGGTSEAAPLTAGTAALVIQAYRKAHNGATPSPAVVKQIIVSTAENINAPADQQGAGMIDAYEAVLAAKSYHVKPGRDRARHPGQRHPAQRVRPARHDREVHRDADQRRGRQRDRRPVQPDALALQGGLDQVALADQRRRLQHCGHLHRAAGQARLNASVSLVGVVNLSLIAPDGDLAEYNLPQGVGNYGNAQVADPAPGSGRP